MEKMEEKAYLRICYWWGSIADLLIGIEMLSVVLMGNFSPFLGLGITISGGNEYKYALSVAMVFMLTWTGILLWADRDPIARKGILFFLIPIIIGLRFSMISAFYFGFISVSTLIIDMVLSLAYLILIVLTLYKTKK